METQLSIDRVGSPRYNERQPAPASVSVIRLLDSADRALARLTDIADRIVDAAKRTQEGVDPEALAQQARLHSLVESLREKLARASAKAEAAGTSAEAEKQENVRSLEQISALKAQLAAMR